MELRDLRYFAVVAEHQNIGRAAESLDLSPTALGKSLRRLEKSVGAKLVQRARKGVALTAVGTALLARIGPLQGMVKDVRQEAADLARGYAGHVTIGIVGGAVEEFTARGCASLASTHTAMTFSVTITTSNFDLSNKLRNGEVEFCITGQRAFGAKEFVRESLYPDPFVIYASAKHRFAGRRTLSLSDLTDERWAFFSRRTRQLQALVTAFSDHNLPPPNVALKANSRGVLAAAVAYSDYLSLTTRDNLREYQRRHNLVVLPVKEFNIVRNLAIHYRKDAYLSPAAMRLIEVLKTQVKEIQRGRFFR